MPQPDFTSPPHRSNVLRWLLWSSAFVATATASATLGALLTLVTPLWLSSPHLQAGEPANPWKGGFQYRLVRPVHLLVMGIDRVPGATERSAELFSGRSDTMLLLRMDPTDYSLSLMSIPRDTQVEIPGLGLTKVNHANILGGPALSSRVVSRTLDDVPIDRYVRISTDALRELVDLLGGVEVFVPKPMSYVDETQKLDINLAQGWQSLNGSQAEQFARFRHDEFGDIGRVQRQQALLKALRQRLTSPSVLPQLPNIVRVMRQYVDTNLSLEEILALVGFGLNIDSNNIKMVMLPGRFSAPQEFSASYWILDQAKVDIVMQDFFKQGNVRTAWDDSSHQRSATPAIGGPRIAIQNASSRPHLSQEVSQYLDQHGFQNFYIVQDWPDRLRQTEIIAQQGDLKAATSVKNALGVGMVEANSTGDLESDVTIRIGEDWPTSNGAPLSEKDLNQWR